MNTALNLIPGVSMAALKAALSWTRRELMRTQWRQVCGSYIFIEVKKVDSSESTEPAQYNMQAEVKGYHMNTVCIKQ